MDGIQAMPSSETGVQAMDALLGRRSASRPLVWLIVVGLCPLGATAQEKPTGVRPTQVSASSSAESPHTYNQELQRLLREVATPGETSTTDYRIGPADLLDVSVLEAPELNRTVRVSEEGELTLPLVGEVRAAGLTSHELETVLEELLRRNYMTDPHVSVFVREIESHAISVLGAVEKPGVYQIRGSEPLIEVLSMSQGLADDAGDTVIVMRHGASASSATAGPRDPISAVASDEPASSANQETNLPAPGDQAALGSIEIKLKELLDTADSRSNVMIHPGDAVKVPRAGIVYVVGEVHKPGGFVLRTGENLSALQALALAEGMTHTSSGRHARIIRTDEITGTRNEMPIDLSRILAGHAPDPLLLPKDILFIPNSSGKTALFRGAEAALSITGGLIIYRR
ncbi:MAG TPA: polysaccharide biosynthesis/export family protein [Candidatus Acidoferrales bacterium]|nr:polysaccharide biosynthesis/export family protein [Candidatus Acidoferrales bacterium]